MTIKMHFKKWALLIALFTLASAPAQASYEYIHNDGEYSLVLPEAPTGHTIWSDDLEGVPFAEYTIRYGSVGERASLHIADDVTGDIFNADILFLKVDPSFLEGLDSVTVVDILKNEAANLRLDNEKFSMSEGTGTLKWATLKGFSISASNNLQYFTAHLLTGMETLMIVKSLHSLEHKEFHQYYQDMTASIKFVGK